MSEDLKNIQDGSMQYREDGVYLFRDGRWHKNFQYDLSFIECPHCKKRINLSD